MDPKVSMIIPVYKTAAWLPKCLDSCLAQTYANIEIILIDDGSPDNCGEICDRYAEQDARVVVIHQENGGVSAARNAGLKKASGEFVLYVDSDDWIDPDMVECMVKEQLAGQYDLVICGRRKFHNQQLTSEITPGKKEMHSRIDVLSDCLQRRKLIYYAPICCKLYRKSIIEEFCLHFDTSLKIDEDFLFALNYLEYTRSEVYVDKALYNIRALTYDKSTHYQTADVELQWNNQIKLFNAYKKLFLTAGAYADVKGKVDRFLLFVIKVVLTRTISAGCPRKAVIAKLKDFSASDDYKDLKAVRFSDVEYFAEKMILFFCKYKLWNPLYGCVKLRVAIYSGR